MPGNLEIQQAQFLLKAALLGLIAAHATDEGYPDGIALHLRLDDGVVSEGEYVVEGLVNGKPASMGGGSL